MIYTYQLTNATNKSFNSYNKKAQFDCREIKE